MTADQHKRILSTTLKKWLPNEDPTTLERIAEAQHARFEMAMELWMEEREQGIVERPPAGEPPIPFPPAPTLQPPPPPVNSAQSSLIIDPNSKQAQDILQNPDRVKSRVPLRLPINPKVNMQRVGAPKKYWDQSQLRDYIDANTPEFISVNAEGRDKPVMLARNIEVQLGPDTVKLIYGVDGTLSPTQSMPNSPQSGEILSATPIDIPVFQTFDCYTQFPDLDTAMQNIQNLAQALFKPRPESLASATPRRTGPLTYRVADPRKTVDPMADPHDEVGELRNPLTGKTW